MYKPRYTITNEIHRLKAHVHKRANAAPVVHATQQMYYDARIRNAHSTLVIENNGFLTHEQVENVVEGKHVPEIQIETQAIKNAYEAYTMLHHKHFESIDPYSTVYMSSVHQAFMVGLVKDAGRFRSSDVVAAGQKHTNTPPFAKLMPGYVDNLLDWAKTSDEHPLIKSFVFHYEFISARPFSEGNGHVARMWQLLLLLPLGNISLRTPILSIVRERREEYHNILAVSDKATGSTKFIEFMLQALLDALTEYEKDPAVKN